MAERDPFDPVPLLTLAQRLGLLVLILLAWAATSLVLALLIVWGLT